MTEKVPYLWIRYASFVALRELLFALTKIQNGFRAKEIIEIVNNSEAIVTQKGSKPSVTTLYHYRNILFHLGVLVRSSRLYFLNKDDPVVTNLLLNIKPGTPFLSEDERRIWGRLVLRNEDCRKLFFNLFMKKGNYTLEEFISDGEPVAWQPIEFHYDRTIKLYNINNLSNFFLIRSEDEVQAVHYGLRYWARNELRIIDEFFLEDLGGVMFPVHFDNNGTYQKIIAYIREEVAGAESQWHTVAVRDLLLNLGPNLKAPVQKIHEALIRLRKNFPEYVVFIPTSEGFATVTAQSKVVETYQLRSYFQDEIGRYISHVRIHKKIRGVVDG